MNKYTYYRVIQQNWGNGWDSVDYHETNSTYWPKDHRTYVQNLKAYRTEQTAPVRVIHQKEKNETPEPKE